LKNKKPSKVSFVLKASKIISVHVCLVNTVVLKNSQIAYLYGYVHERFAAMVSFVYGFCSQEVLDQKIFFAEAVRTPNSPP
jgi:hypothetical protein